MNQPPRTVLACTDFSPAGDAAVQRAAALAVETGAQFILLHVVPTSLWSSVVQGLAGSGELKPPDTDRVLEQVRARVQLQAGQLAAASGCAGEVNLAAEVAHGRPAIEIARVARARGADLIVVGAHGAHPILALTVGTTAQKLLRVAPCPVLVVKRPPPFDYATVLLPTDLSAPAAAAAKVARTLWPRAVFHVAHAYELPYEGLMTYAGASAAAVEQCRRDAEQRLRAELQEFIGAAAFGAGRAVAHLHHGYPPTLIDEWVQALRADLVVIAAHGKSEVEALFLGSVSAHVILSADCDVLLVRGADAAPRTPDAQR